VVKSQYLSHTGPDNYAVGRENIAHQWERCGWPKWVYRRLPWPFKALRIRPMRCCSCHCGLQHARSTWLSSPMPLGTNPASCIV